MWMGYSTLKIIFYFLRKNHNIREYYRAFNLKITSFNWLCTMAEIVADIAIHRRISCFSVGLKILCLVGVTLEDLVGNYPLCTMAPIYLLRRLRLLREKA